LFIFLKKQYFIKDLYLCDIVFVAHATKTHKLRKKIMNKQELIARVDLALNDIRPHLFVDGGNIEVLDVNDDMIVQLRWLGNCEGCLMSAMTMKAGVEQTLRSKMPEIMGVNAVN
jgi:Fe-S cluster biogenesis protein NfuA